MSKLDDILSECAFAIAAGVVTDLWEKAETKQQIKDLMLELIGKDEDPQSPLAPLRMNRLIEAENGVRQELRQKVKAL